MNKKRYCFLMFVAMCVHSLLAQNANPTAVFTDVNGEEVEDVSSGVSAPLTAHFEANPKDYDGYTARYEWQIYQVGAADTLKRFTETVDHIFSTSGSYRVELKVTFSKGTEYYDWIMKDEGVDPFFVVVSESKLEMPNAFSPNGDGYNDVYKVKSGYQSIVKFEATIFNRWGQKIYSWTDLEGGWDGKWHGKTVSDGVYFVNVNAMGADGHHYKIKRDVNVVSGVPNKDRSTTADY